MAFRIPVHAARQLAGNLRRALILSVLPGILFLVTCAGLLAPPELAAYAPGLWALGAVSIAVLLLIFAFSWLATGWHRYVLMNQPVRFLATPDRMTMRYM